MVERLQQHDGEEQHDAGNDKRLAEIVAVFVVHRQKHQIKQTHQHEAEAEEGQICLNADGVIDLCIAPAEEHERNADERLQELERHDGRKPRPDQIALRERQQRHVIYVPVLAGGLQHEENAEGIVEKRYVIRIARHEHQRAQQQKQQRHRRDGQLPFLFDQQLHASASRSRCTMICSRFAGLTASPAASPASSARMSASSSPL